MQMEKLFGGEISFLLKNVQSKSKGPMFESFVLKNIYLCSPGGLVPSTLPAAAWERVASEYGSWPPGEGLENIALCYIVARENSNL